MDPETLLLAMIQVRETAEDDEHAAAAIERLVAFVAGEEPDE